MGTGSSVSRANITNHSVANGNLFEVDSELRHLPVEISQRRAHPSSLQSFGAFRHRRGGSTKSAFSAEKDSNIDKRLARELDAHLLKECHDLKLAHEKLEEENRILRLELKMQTVKAERVAAVEREKDKIQNLFKMYRESKEKELQDLLKAKRDLETKLQKLHSSKPILGEELNLASGTPQRGSSSDLFSNHPGEWWLPLDITELPNQLVSTVRGPELAQALMEADGPFTNVSKIDWSVAALSLTQSHLMWQPCSIIKVYVSAGPDMTGEAEILGQLCHRLHSACEAENRFFQFMYLPFENSKATARHAEKYRPIMRRELESCDIFVAFLGSSHSKFMKDEVEFGYLNSPASKPAVFVFKNESKATEISSRRTGSTSSKSLVTTLKSKIRATGKAKIIEDWVGCKEAAQVAYEELDNFVQIELGDCSEMDSALSESCDEEDIPPSITNDRRDEAEQFETFSQIVATPGTFGFDKYFEHLDEHVSGSGPLPPLLVLGDEGSGKTQLLAKWIERQRERSPGTLILYHFAGHAESCSSDPVLMMRRLTAEMMRLSGIPYSLSCDGSRLETEFPRWLDKIASHRQGGVILVIDSIDRLESGEQHLGWLFDPLPVDARVVLSANDQTCLEAWRMLPTMKIQPLSVRDARSLLKLWLGNTKSLITSEQEVKLVSNGKTTISPLHIVLTAKYLASDCTATTLGSRIKACVNCQQAGDVVSLILEKLEDEMTEVDGFKGYIVKVLSLIVCSANGMAGSEILHLAPAPLTVWTPLYYALIDRHILTETAGLLKPTNWQVGDAIRRKYMQVGEQRMHYCKQVAEFFEGQLCSVTNRVSDELPRVLCAMEDKGRLHEVITNILVFLRLYRRGRCSQLIRYWQMAGADQVGMAQHYCDAIQKLQEGEVDTEKLKRVACLYENVGHFLRDLGLMSQAVGPLQRALEVREQTLDPDHPSVAQSLYQLGNLYTQWGKFSTAEELYQQAMEITDTSHGAESLQMARHLEALAILYKKQDRNEEAETLHRQALIIQQKLQSQPQLYKFNVALRDRRRHRAVQLGELAMSPESPGLARSLNELGVLYYLQDNHELAQQFFERALEMRENILGREHPDIAQSLHNLASLYNAQERFGDAVLLYERALAIRQKAFPSEHPSVATTVNQLAILYRKQNEYGKAEPLYKQALGIREKSFGASHPSVATALNNLAVLYCKMHKYSSAEPLYQRALKIYEESFGPGHFRVAETLRNLAVLQYDKGDFESAARLYKRCTDIKEQGPSVSRPPSEFGKSEWAGDSRSLYT